jgi:transposase
MTSTVPTQSQAFSAHPTIHLAIELSRMRWVVAAHLPGCDKISLHDVEGGNGPALLALIDRLVQRVERQLGQPPSVVSCFEAGFDGFWLHRFLEQNQVSNFVLDSTSIQVPRRARRTKTDRVDAAAMLRVLMAYCRGETKICSIVRVPSVDEEDARRTHRERERLVRERIQHTNRIQGLLAAQGTTGFRPARRDWEQQLEHLRTGDGRLLPPYLKQELHRECRRLALVNDMIADVERVRDEAIAENSSDPTNVTALLLQLKGIGPAFAQVLAREVFYRTFANRRSLASYVGLTPAPYDSGDSRRDQGISKAGNTRARMTLIELAWLWMRYQPQSDLATWFRARAGTGPSRMRRIAIVAVARKLLVSLWRYLHTGIVPPGAECKTMPAVG